MSDAQALLRANDADANTLLSVRGLTKVYQTGAVKVHALRGIDLTVKRGELIVMLGASGSGKSTLLNIIGGLDTPTTGTVTFMGEDITDLRPSGLTQFRRAHVGFIFQFYNLVPSLTARENVALVTEISQNPIAPEEALRMVGLGERIHHFPAQLSGGEQQRVAVARAIAKRPNLLLCDEPTGALDSRTGVQVLEALKTVNEELGATTLIITHNVGIAEMSDRVIRLSDGMISEEQAMHRRRNPSELSW
ncbi:MAG: ABC transporter ATP-binding protein [Hyphomonadaceae bacterium]|nr:ABC transporter ATP-binding protein [Hyphomonadaceae bacterium]